MNMSLFPTGEAAMAARIAHLDCAPETDGVLVRPIGGQIYLIEETDLERLSPSRKPPRMSGLISRH
jgi:hypothetical protein